MDKKEDKFYDFYNGKRVLVTGADGFMGSHLVDRLVNMGAKVTAYVRGSSVTGTNRFELKNIRHHIDNIKIIAGDISSPDSKNLIVSNNPEIIFHLAAEAYVPKSFNQPLEVIDANVYGTLNVLEASRSMGNVLRTVCTSSSEIYGTHDEPIKESDIMNPTSPYGASKLAADRFAWSWWNTYKIPIAIVRPFNTYGPRHTYDVVPFFINKALNGEALTIHGDGTQTRDLMYVEDTINAFLIMGSHNDAIGKAVNFGTGKDIMIKDVAQKIKLYSNSNCEIVHIAPRTSEVKRLCCDPSLAKSLFGWSATISIDEGLKRNIEWVKAQRK
ncbi:GDP-mannose 4,6-dehydratase [Candidatus Woesearchaeota archaeon]|nr:GDP-mannose 4,6-dehydratase [Candidatus Woesearchaeota archaeon]